MSPEEFKEWQLNLAHIPLDLKLKTLPLDIPWKDFENLCMQLAKEESNFEKIEITSAMLYGRDGQKQEGIDVKATIPNSSKFFVMQCKRYKSITAGDIDTWIDGFLKGKFSSQTYMYVLATSFDVSSDTKLVDSWHAAQQKLDSLGIKSVLWDKQTILAKLKNAPKVTSVFWGEQIASRYCHQDLSENKYPYSYAVKNVNVFDNFIHIDNRTCHLDLMVPNRERGIKVGGIFSFARKDLHGTTFSIDGSALVPLMQVKAHSKSLRETTYLHQNQDKYYLSLENIRLSLEENEVDDLDWILSEAFSRYSITSKAIESQYKTIRFDRSSSDFKVQLCEIKKPLWNTIIKYAYAHDIANGEGSNFIFDSAPGCLKVFVNQNTTDLDFGYHLIIYPKPSNSISNDNIILEWEPLNDIAGQPIEITRRKAWDAEYTYQWLHTSLFPKVYQWALKQDKKEETWIKRIFQRGNEDNPLPLEYFIINSYKPSSRTLGQGARTLDEVSNYTDKLQRHFTCYQRKATIEKQLIVDVINACILLLSKNTELNCDYIRGNLRLGNGSTHEELLILKAKQDSCVYATSTMLDMALRSLGKLLEMQSELSQYDIDCLADCLSSVSSRYEEDQICSIYC